MKITREIFDAQRMPRYGKANPERMEMAFWEWMIRGDEKAVEEADENAGKKGGLLESLGLTMRGGILKSSYGPYRARDLFQVPMNREEGPIWNFDRMGMSKTVLPDGRVIHIAGEHEDHYDPDFFIYNDIVVFGSNNQIEIYGYPKDIFPPTDFHTATLIGNTIIIIGCLGYPEQRRPGHTPVYSLNLDDYSIKELATSGQSPSWIFGHVAELQPDGTILIEEGEIVIDSNSQRHIAKNVECFSFDPNTLIWTRTTNRDPVQICIHRLDGERYPFRNDIDSTALFESLLEFAEDHQINSRDSRDALFLSQSNWFRVQIEFGQIRVMLDPSLSKDQQNQIVTLITQNLEEMIGIPCEVIDVSPK